MGSVSIDFIPKSEINGAIADLTDSIMKDDSGSIQIGVGAQNPQTQPLVVNGQASINVGNVPLAASRPLPNSRLIICERQQSNLSDEGGLGVVISNNFGNSVRTSIRSRRVVENDQTIAGAGTRIVFDAETADENVLGNQAAIAGVWDSTATAGNENGRLAFFTAAANTLTERMRITSAGNVAIGTTSAPDRLTVSGTTRSTDITASNNITARDVFATG